VITAALLVIPAILSPPWNPSIAGGDRLRDALKFFREGPKRNVRRSARVGGMDVRQRFRQALSVRSFTPHPPPHGAGCGIAGRRKVTASSSAWIAAALCLRSETTGDRAALREKSGGNLTRLTRLTDGSRCYAPNKCWCVLVHQISIQMDHRMKQKLALYF
jgi:hypothetical protein